MSMIVGHDVAERSMDLGRTPTTAAAVRHWLVAELEDLKAMDRISRDQVEVAELLASELVANVFLHTTSSATASMCLDEQLLVVSISDDDPTVPQLPAIDTTATSGRGLRLVADLSHRWGIHAHPHGKAIWFSVCTSCTPRSPNGL